MKTSTQDQEMNALGTQGGNLVAVTRGTSPSTQSNTLRSDEQTATPQSPTSPRNETVKSEPVVIIRPSFKKICGDGDACRAAIFNQMLYNIAWKVKQGGDYWYGTLEEIWHGVDCSWGLSKVIKEVRALVARGLLGQRRNLTKGFDQTRQYFFGVEQANTLRTLCEQVGVCLSTLGLPDDISHLLKITNAISQNNNPSVTSTNSIYSNQQMETVKITDASVESNRAIPKNTTKITSKKTTEEQGEGNRPTSAKTEPLPSLPPSSSSSLVENKFKNAETPLRKGVLALIEKHLVPSSRKETDMDKQTALAEMERRFTSLAQLVGEDEALRQCEIALLYLKHVDKFWREHHQFLTLIKAEKNIDEALAKSKSWTPPSDALRLYPDLPAAIAPMQETKTDVAQSCVITQDNLEGMTMEEAEALDVRLSERYPGIEISYGELPGQRYTVGVRCGSGDEDWIELFKASDWYQATGFRRKRIERAMSYYRLTHPQTEEIQRLAVAV